MGYDRSTQDELSNHWIFNGIAADSGTYLWPKLSLEELSLHALGETIDSARLRELEHRHRRDTEAHLGVREGVDPTDLSEAGWGVIFAASDADAIPGWKDALRPLLERRRSQAGERYREFCGEDGYQPGESKDAFLARHGMGPGAADPRRIPYYLLLVADPEAIPYSFQFQLDISYAVGRLHFDGEEDYGRYAQAVVRSEDGAMDRSKQVVLFGVRNPDDQATALSSEELIKPLAEALGSRLPAWTVRHCDKEKSTKADLMAILQDPRPALLFTASHGMGFRRGHPLQKLHQGALLCSDWPGPLAWGEQPIPQHFYFSVDDLEKAQVGGMILFLFACFGAGTPRFEDYGQPSESSPRQLADQAFISRLPQALLCHPQGGALAVVSHVERSSSWSFRWPGAVDQQAVFEDTLLRLMKAHPVGWAMEYFSSRYAEIAILLSEKLRETTLGKRIKVPELAGLWTVNNDMRSFVIIGDPAVRIPSSQHDS